MNTAGRYWVYMMASRIGGTLYIGVTNDLARRVFEHRQGQAEGFSKSHNVKRLVYYEEHASVEAAISREKRLKKWPRKWKIQLLEEANPNWDDRYAQIAKH